jgi:peptidoglycan-associated lipoprotein
MRNIGMMMFATLLLVACASAPQERAEVVEAKPVGQSAGATPGAELGAPTSAEVSTQGLTESAIAAQQQGLQDKSIYFDFDTFVIKPEYRGLLRQHVDILQAHPGDSVTLEGNADERGSSEYNLVIGSKRAYAVKVQLTLLGIAGSRIHEVSYGEEKPRATCHEETCWQQNRRVDFVYRAEK